MYPKISSEKKSGAGANAPAPALSTLCTADRLNLSAVFEFFSIFSRRDAIFLFENSQKVADGIIIKFRGNRVSCLFLKKLNQRSSRESLGGVQLTNRCLKIRRFIQNIDIFLHTSYNNISSKEQVCLFKCRNKRVYRNALSCGAFRRGCAAIPQTGVG